MSVIIQIIFQHSFTFSSDGRQTDRQVWAFPVLYSPWIDVKIDVDNFSGWQQQGNMDLLGF